MAGLTRRLFLQAGTGALAAVVTTVVPRAASARAARAPFVPDAPDRKALAFAAVDAARGAGAGYADARLQVVQTERWEEFAQTVDDYSNWETTVTTGIAVRALVNGYWGATALDGAVSLDDAAWLGQAAVAQAKSAARGKPRPAPLAPTAPVIDKHWTMPVAIDPFTVSSDEKIDFLMGVRRYYHRQPSVVNTSVAARFVKEDRGFASSDGSYVTQTLFRTSGELSVYTPQDWLSGAYGEATADFLTPAGMGWEYLREAPYRDEADALIDLALRSRRRVPVDIGRYEVVFDAAATASLLDETIGAATELHRASGYWANEGGTSFLVDPAGMLGTFQMAAPIVTITADRSMPGGAATLQWDDEGVTPDASALVTRGMLTDFQTTRESAEWIAPYYRGQGRPVRSHGYAGSDALEIPLSQAAPNFTLAPGGETASFADLVTRVKKGYAVLGGTVATDQQRLTGWGSGSRVFKIEDGKIGSAITGFQFQFRTPEFWKNVTALGGVTSARRFGLERRDTPRNAHTVAAVPMLVANVAVAELRPDTARGMIG